MIVIGILIVIFDTQVLALTPQEKIQYIDAASKSAKESVQKNKIAEARLALLAVLTEVHGFLPAANQSPIKELFIQYMEARNMAWQNAPSQLTNEDLNVFLSAFEKNKTTLMKLSADMNMTTGLPNGKKAYYRHITNVLAQRESAWKIAGDFAIQTPPPDHLIGNQQVFMKIFSLQIPMTFHNISFGPALAAAHAQQRVIPENIKIADETIQKAMSSKEPSEIWGLLADAGTSLDMESSMEASLKGEIDVSTLTVKVPGLKKQMSEELARAETLFNAQVDSNRMPVDITWKGGNRTEVIEQTKTAFMRSFPEEKVLKIALRNEDFGERWETWWDKDTLYSAYFGYVKAAVASKQPTGKCRVFIKWFRKELKADGSWTPLYYHKTVDSYLIREKNV